MRHRGNEFHISTDKLNIIYDDIGAQIGYLMQFTQNITPDLVNYMIKFGRGLVYTCITEEKAQELKLPILYSGYADKENINKNFTVSVDYCLTTTGISAEERAVTIKAFTDPLVVAEDFRRPGHVFPLVSKSQGLLERVGIAEATIDLATFSLYEPSAFICEILNALGDIASWEEINQLALEHELNVIKISELLAARRELLNTAIA
jgi:3,4-dihydroxy-2-butanone 4-phosphate synthase